MKTNNNFKALKKKLKTTKKLKGFKENLPTKICPQCARPFQYRKKWKKVWHEVVYCSQRCKTEVKKTPKNN